jgi:hypothetical protein
MVRAQDAASSFQRVGIRAAPGARILDYESRVRSGQ